MKSILVLRHAKSDWDATFDSDHDRPLNKRGKKTAPLIGRFVKHTAQVPDLILSSTAVRARSTVETAIEAGKWNRPVEPMRELYGTTPDAILSLLRSTKDSVDSVMLVGHEPTWSSLVSKLTGGGRTKFPTATLARIDFETGTWADIEFGTGQLVFFLPPRILGKLYANSGTT